MSSSNNQKKAITLSPFKKSSNTPIQNRFAPITPSPTPITPTYSALVKSPITITPTRSGTIPLGSQINTPFSQKISPFSQKTSTSSSSSPSSSYLINTNDQTIKILEDYEVRLHSQGFHILTDFLFPKTSLFIGSIHKTREFYEAILIETASIKITHTPNPKNPSQIDYSKAQILRVLSIQEWKARPFTEKTLSGPGFSRYPNYNYYDYQDAWYNFLYLRSYSHSWFLFFDKNFDCLYPRWFVKWFKYCGNILESFPLKIKEGFSKFQELFVQDIPEFEYILQFTMLFKIPWILSWTFSVTQASGTSPSLLKRTYRVKWWDKLPTEQAEKMTIQGISNYYSINFGVPASISNPYQDDEEQEIAHFMAANSKEEIRRLIKEIKQNSSGSSSDTQEIQESLFQDDQDPYIDIKM